jgi:Flp pilus assembly pilin Flp
MAEAGWADRVGQVRVWMDAAGVEVAVIVRQGSVVVITARSAVRYADLDGALGALASVHLSGRMLAICGPDAGRMLALAKRAELAGATLVEIAPGDARFDL